MGLDLDLFEDDVPEELVCALCRQVVVNPVQGVCTHLFCKACLRRSSKGAGVGSQEGGGGTCPTCQAPLQGHVAQQPSVEVKVKLLSLLVHCSHHCGKICTLAELPDHIAEECPNAPVTCPHARRGCKMSVKRAEVQEHVQECDYRHVICEACGQRTLFIDLFTHQSRKRCLEKKLRQQLIKAVKITNTEVKQHKRYLERQHHRLEQQQRQRLLDHHRHTMATAKAQRHPRPQPITSSGNSSNGSEYDTRSVVSTEIMSFDPHSHVQPYRDMFLTSSKAGEMEAEGGSERAVALQIPSPCRSGSSIATCRNCRRQFRENLNSPNSCRWHPGPIIDLFGGTCYACGRLDYQKGCMMGYHEL